MTRAGSKDFPRKNLVMDENEQVKNMYKYSQKYSSSAPPAAQEVYEETFKSDLDATMMISPEEGLFLSTLVSLRRPKIVLEAGCFVGYSALWIAEGLEYNKQIPGHLYTAEIDERTAKIARKNIEKGGKSHLVDVINKPAQEVLDGWDPNNKIDIVFLDADKEGYINYYETLLNKNLLADDGVIVCDNTLFHSHVHPLEEKYKGQPIQNPKTIAEHVYNFNIHIAQDDRTEKVLLPVFDGVTMIRRKN